MLPYGAALAIEIIRDPNAWDFAPLEYYDAVVIGHVSRVDSDYVSTTDLFMRTAESGTGMRVRLKRVTLRVQEVLRGAVVSGDWTFCVPLLGREYDTPYRNGDRLLICAYAHPRLGFYLKSYYGKYNWNGSGWVSGETPRGVREFGDMELREKINATSLESVAAAAELIVTGTVASIQLGEIQGPGGDSAETRTVNVVGLAVHRGDWDGDSIEVTMLTRGLYLPTWATHVPDKMSVGERWVWFLRRGEGFWYPFAGSNGMLRIVKDGLVYDSRIPYWRSEAELERTVSALRGRGQ